MTIPRGRSPVFWSSGSARLKSCPFNHLFSGAFPDFPHLRVRLNSAKMNSY